MKILPEVELVGAAHETEHGAIRKLLRYFGRVGDSP